MSRTTWRDLYKLGAISAITASSRQSRRDGRYLAAISPRSRRDLESDKHHGEISVRSLQSRRDLGENFARVDNYDLNVAISIFFLINTPWKKGQRQ